MGHWADMKIQHQSGQKNHKLGKFRQISNSEKMTETLNDFRNFEQSKFTTNSIFLDILTLFIEFSESKTPEMSFSFVILRFCCREIKVQSGRSFGQS